MTNQIEEAFGPRDDESKGWIRTVVGTVQRRLNEGEDIR